MMNKICFCLFLAIVFNNTIAFAQHAFEAVTLEKIEKVSKIEVKQKNKRVLYWSIGTLGSAMAGVGLYFLFSKSANQDVVVSKKENKDEEVKKIEYRYYEALLNSRKYSEEFKRHLFKGLVLAPALALGNIFWNKLWQWLKKVFSDNNNEFWQRAAVVDAQLAALEYIYIPEENRNEGQLDQEKTLHMYHDFVMGIEDLLGFIYFKVKQGRNKKELVTLTSRLVVLIEQINTFGAVLHAKKINVAKTKEETMVLEQAFRQVIRLIYNFLDQYRVICGGVRE